MNLSRRKFLLRSGWAAGGLTVMAVGGYSIVPPLPVFGKPDVSDIFTWVQLLPNGRVRYYLSRAELGQGISTGLSQVVAEELQLPLSMIDCHYQDTSTMAPCQMTVGSQSIENYLELTARSAAYLRETLQQRAATIFETSLKTISLGYGGFVLPDNQQIKYADLLSEGEASLAPLTPVREVKLLSLRPKAELSVIGKLVEPVHVRRIAEGQETYSRDVQVKNMHYGVLARPPQLGAKTIRFDSGAAKAVTGVIEVVTNSDDLAIVAKTPMAAAKGLEALAVEWDSLDREALAAVQQSLDIDRYLEDDALDHSAEATGSVQNGAENATQSFSLRYDSPMAAHAAMEPRSGVASWHVDDSGHHICEVWTGCQDPWLVKAAVAEAIGVDGSQVIVRNHRVGGAFGGRVLCQASVEASWLSKAVGVPVKVQWSREEEFRYNYVGPQFSTRIETGLDSNGRISHWHHQAVGAPILTTSMFLPPYMYWIADLLPDPGTQRGMTIPYAISNHQLDFADERLPMPTGPWRGLGAAPNTFAVECAMDELALAANQDPIEFRLKHLNHPRLSRCLKRLQSKIAGSQPTMGIAAAAYKGVTFLALAAEIEVKEDRIKVTRLICIHDCGRVISPDQVRAQIEGNLIWGIGMALKESFELDNGIARTTNFDSYILPRQVDVPDFEIELIDSNDAPSGAAEASFTAAAAAIANALSRVTGKRHRKLPLTVSGNVHA